MQLFSGKIEADANEGETASTMTTSKVTVATSQKDPNSLQQAAQASAVGGMQSLKAGTGKSVGFNLENLDAPPSPGLAPDLRDDQ